MKPLNLTFEELEELHQILRYTLEQDALANSKRSVINSALDKIEVSMMSI